MARINMFNAFVRVIEHENFTRAAASLGMPRSSVSTAVNNLETYIGTRLLKRSTRQVCPTREGLLLYERIKHLLNDIDAIESLFRQDNGNPSGKIHIELPPWIGRHIVSPALPEFLEQYPGIEIHMGLCNHPVDFVRDTVDCMLHVGDLPDSRLIARHIGRLAFVNVASPAYLERHGAPETPGELEKGHFAVRLTSPAHDRGSPWTWSEASEIHTLSLAARVTATSMGAGIACCLAGLGLVQAPACEVREHLAAGTLVEILPDYRPAPAPVALLYTDRRFMPHRVHLFADWLVRHVRQEIGK